MSRRRNGPPDLVEVLFPAVALLGFLFYFGDRIPGGVVAIVKGLGPVVWSVGFLAVAFVGFRIFQRFGGNPDGDRGSQPRGHARGRQVADDVPIQHVSRPAFAPRPQPPETTVAPVRGGASLADRLRAIDWYQFEKIVALLYEAKGYQVTRRGGANPDGGVDLLATKDGRRTAIQCKHWQTWAVKPDKVRELIGAKNIEQADACVLVTLQGLTKAAEELARQQSVELVDASHLEAWLGELQYTPLWSGIQKALDSRDKQCPRCEAPLVQRVAGRGKNVGGTFWGCSTYPQCRFTLPVNA